MSTKRFAAPVLLLLIGLGCGGNPTAPASVPTPVATPAPAPMAVILSVDGLRPDAFAAGTPPLAAAPSILGLARRGAYTWRADTIFPSWTLPAHSSMLSGQPPSAHHILWDDWQPAKGVIAVPTVFMLAKAAGLRTAMVVGKDKFQHLNVPGSLDAFVLVSQGDAEVANQAIVQIQMGADLLFVHFPDTDLSGHASGWLSPSYLAHVEAADRAIGRVLSALPPSATVILTADHGGHAATHGGTAPEDVTIPWVIAGPRVTPHQITSPVRTVDTAATALGVLGLSLPVDATGSVVSEAFAGH